MKVGDLIEWNLHSVCPKAIVIGFNGDFAKLFWFPNSRFSNAGKVSMVGTRELKVISESR
jgi:hypothetical protein